MIRSGASSDGYTFTQNSIYGNDGLGIDIAADGVNDNDADDVDLGANARINHPFVTATMWSGGMLNVIGCFDGNPAEDITALRSIKLVMKGGHVYRNELGR